MHPVLFNLGSFEVGSYALMALLGLSAACGLSAWLAGRAGLDRTDWCELVLWVFIVALLGSKIFGAVLEFDPERPADAFLRSLRFGGTWYAGLLAGLAFLVVAFRRRGIDVLRGLDVLAPGVALGHVFGRIGCLLAGCCYGTSCDGPMAVTFRSEDAHRLTGVPLGVPLHPVQLYEAGVELVNVGLLMFLHLRRGGPRFPGRVVFQYVVFYGVSRFLLEELRDDPRGELIAGLSTSQALALVLVTGGLLAWIVSYRAARAKGSRR